MPDIAPSPPPVYTVSCDGCQDRKELLSDIGIPKGWIVIPLSGETHVKLGLLKHPSNSKAFVTLHICPGCANKGRR